MSPSAVVYIRTDDGLSPIRQRTACTQVCFRDRIRIRYWAQGGELALADALRIVDAGRAHVLVVAHHSALGDIIAQQAIRAHLADIRARLLIAHGTPKMTLPPGADLAARMRREGMSVEQISHVLQLDKEHVVSLLDHARRRGLLGVAAALLAVGMVAPAIVIEQDTAPPPRTVPGVGRPPPFTPPRVAGLIPHQTQREQQQTPTTSADRTSRSRSAEPAPPRRDPVEAQPSTPTLPGLDIAPVEQVTNGMGITATRRVPDPAEPGHRWSRIQRQ